MKPAGFCIGICLAFATGCADSRPSTPAIWKVSDADNSLYLLGSFHALRTGDYPLSKEVDAAYADAELLVFELAPTQLQSPELPAKIAQMAALPPGVALQALLPEKTRLALAEWSGRNPSFPVQALQRYEPWYVAMTVINAQARSEGFEAELGLDQHFMSLAENTRKPSRGLETAEQQIGLFDSIDMAAQIQLLDEALSDTSDDGKRLEQLHRLWKSGDVAEFEQQTVTEMRREYPDLYRSINVARNQAWLPELRKLLDDEHQDDALAVVGALHLLGPDGLVQQLQGKGYKVERLK